MKQAKDNPEVISLCPEARLRDNLREANKLLEQVQKGLSEYLETKRMSFPRFYFLSDDELLQILSQTKDPKAVQPHLRKCFENITRVKFESDMRISTMYSAEQEEVVFRKDVYPVGNVEDWMCEIERVMRETLRQVIRDALDDYREVKRKKNFFFLSNFDVFLRSFRDREKNGFNIGRAKSLLPVHKLIGPNKFLKLYNRKILLNITNNNYTN